MKLKDKKKFNKLKFPLVKTTVGAVIYKNEKILLQKRNINPERGKWALPGGHMEIGETALIAIKREIKEETGFNLKNIKFLFYFDEFIPNLKIHAIVLIFYASPIGKEKINSESIQQKWFTKEKALRLKLAFKHNEILKKFFKEK